MRRPAINAATIALLAWSLCATAHADDIDAIVRAEMARQKLPGLALAIVRDGTVVKVQGYGHADVARAVPVTPDTVFKIGSVSKPLIASAVMLLAQEGRLSLDDPVSKYLEGTPDTWKAITIRHFLTHTSGVVREGPAFDPFRVQPVADVIRSAYPMPLRFPTGTKWEYCNVGYFSLAEIIGRVSGGPWFDFLAARQALIIPNHVFQREGDLLASLVFDDVGDLLHIDRRRLEIPRQARLARNAHRDLVVLQAVPRQELLQGLFDQLRRIGFRLREQLGVLDVIEAVGDDRK